MKQRPVLFLITLGLALSALAASAALAAAAPLWEVSSAVQTRFAPGGTGVVAVSVKNVGDQASDGSGALDLTMPAGMSGVFEPQLALAFQQPGPHEMPSSSSNGTWNCADPKGLSALHCDLAAAIAPGQEAELVYFKVAVPAESPAQPSAHLEVSGGGAPTPAAIDAPLNVSASSIFDVDRFDGAILANPGYCPSPEEPKDPPDPCAPLDCPNSVAQPCIPSQCPTAKPCSYNQAAGHPYAVYTSITFNTRTDAVNGDFWPDEPLKDVFVDIPPGLVGNTTVIKECSLDQLIGSPETNEHSTCDPAAQVGTATITFPACPAFPSDPCAPFTSAQVPVYSLTPPPEVPARFGFVLASTVVTLDIELRSAGNYALKVNARNASEALPITGTSLTFWGVPADEIHTPERLCPGDAEKNAGNNGCRAGVPALAFMRMPSACEGPQPTTLHTDSWFNPGSYRPDGSAELSDPRWKEASFTAHQIAGDPQPGAPLGTTACEQVPFEPQISVSPTTTQADSPSGLEVDLRVPQDEITDSQAIAQSDLRKSVLTLPAGMRVNPASAEGLGACTLAQIDLHSQNTEPTCPDSSKIGTVSVQTPLLEEPLAGSVYLGAQKDNPFGSLLAIYIVAEAGGQIVKLAGEVTPGPDGRLITAVEVPPTPFSTTHLQLRGGPRGALITPPACGTHTASATLTPWSGNAPVDLESSFELTEGPGGAPCPSGELDPRMSAGTRSPLAGAHSPFDLRLTRSDGTRELTGLSATLAPGLLGRLAGIPYCPESALAAVSGAEGTAAAQIAAPSCPAASQLGAILAGAGAGPTPFFLDTGRVYLAGPYKGAPLSLAVITPVLAGPFDLGTVLVRAALQIDPATTQVRAVSDPLPLALHGIALDLRDLRVSLERPYFILNPTSCEPMAIEAEISGTGGASAHRSQHFQVANCADLGFGPKLSLRLQGGTHRTDHPALRATLRMPVPASAPHRCPKPKGKRTHCHRPAPQANIARAAVTLPASELLDNAHIGAVCTRVQYAAGRGGGEQCPPRSIYGHARAFTPLLDAPLEGPVYLRSSDHPLPDLVASLGGQIHVDLLGTVDSVNGGIRNRFELVPDAPVSKFVLTLAGGRKGLLQNSTDLCAHHHQATARFDGQNGKLRDFRPLVRADCGPKHRKGRGGGRG